MWRREQKPKAECAYEIEEELRLHLEERAEQLIASGFDPKAAEQEARRRLGDLEDITRRCRRYDRQGRSRERRRLMLDGLLQDLRLALRGALRQPGFATVVVLTLALATGALTAIWSVVDTVLLRPLPFLEAGELVVVWQNDRLTGTSRELASYPDSLDFREGASWFEGVAAYQTMAGNLAPVAGSDPEQVGIVRASFDFAEVLGLELRAGRFFDQSEDRRGGPAVAVLSESLRQRLFGREQRVVGRMLEIDDVSHTVIGVIAPGFERLQPGVDVFLPLQLDAELAPRYTHGTGVLARLAKGHSVSGAQVEMNALASALEAEHPENANRGVFLEPLDVVLRGRVRPMLWLVLSGGALLLLVAAANVVGLLIARELARRRELATHRALGAGRLRLVRRYTVEGLLYAGCAATLAAGLAFSAVRLVAGLAPAELFATAKPAVDPRSALLLVALVPALALLFAAAPALSSGHEELARALALGRGQATARSTASLRRGLIVAQVAIALVLLCGAGLIAESLRRLAGVDKGFSTENVLRLDFRLPPSRYPRDFANFPQWTEINNFNREVLDRVAGIPGVRSAAIVSNHPLDPGFTNSFVIRGREEESLDFGELSTRIVSADYFSTVGGELLEGRLFTSADDAEAPLALLLNREAAERYFADRSVIGARIRFWGRDREVVGVVANERTQGVDKAPPPAMYVNLAQAPQRNAATLMVKSERDPYALVDGIRTVVRAIDRELALYGITTMDETLLRSMARQRLTASVLGAFSLVAALLALVGVHGLLAYQVAQRRRELGLRLALGALPRSLLLLVARQGLFLTSLGVAIGVLGALALGRFYRSLLYEVSPTEPAVYGVAALVFLAVAGAACWIAARRAGKVEPVRALASE